MLNAKCYANRLEEEQIHVQQSEFRKATLGDRSAGTETCSPKEKKEKDGKRTEHSKEVLDKNKIRERDRGQEGAEGIQEDARRIEG